MKEQALANILAPFTAVRSQRHENKWFLLADLRLDNLFAKLKRSWSDYNHANSIDADISLKAKIGWITFMISLVVISVTTYAQTAKINMVVSVKLYAQTTKTNLRVNQTISTQHPAVGEVIIYTMVIANAVGYAPATGVRIMHTLPKDGVTYVPLSASVLRGNSTYSADSGQWLVGLLQPGDSTVLQVKATVRASGVFYNTLEVIAADLPDAKSTPGNHNIAEEDYSTVCFSVPIQLSRGEEFTVTIPSGYGAITWYRNDQPVRTLPDSIASVNADSSLTIKSAGSYRFTLVRNRCQAVNCCAIEVVSANSCNVQPPTLVASTDTLCARGPVSLTAAGCAGGTVVWNVADKAGSVITVNPDATASYSAQCKYNNCLSESSNSIRIILLTPAAPIIAVTKTLICSGEKVTLTATGCQGGIVKWYPAKVVGTSVDLYPTATGEYYATCKLGSCESDASNKIRITVNTSNIPAPTITASNTAVYSDGVVSLTATGCTGGTVLWSDGQTGAIVSVTATLAKNEFYAICKSASGCGSGKSNVIKVAVTPKGLVGVAKSVGTPVVVSEGVYDIPYTITVSNMGDAPLNHVQVTDNLSATFGKGALIVNNRIHVVSTGSVTVDTMYSGQGKITKMLVDSFSTLAIGTKASLDFTVRVDVKHVNPDSLTFYNTAEASALTPTSEVVRDVSTTGINSDPDNDLDPRNNNQPTLVTLNGFSTTSYIGLALALQDTARQSDGSYNVTYQIVVKNYGAQLLKNVTITDSLSDAFSAQTGAAFSLVGSPIITSTGSALRLNTNFNGTTDPVIVIGDSTSTLIAGKVDTIRVVINVISNGSTTTFLNTAYAQAKAESGIISDISTNGVNPDLNGNGNPTDSNERESTPLNLPPTSSSVFIPQGFSPNGDGINDLFVIRGLEGVTVSFEVYNRWGHLVYKNDDYHNDWNGKPNTGITIEGNGLPDGTYYYTIKVSDGRKFVRYMTINR
jgi:gliding motility-associated-like protein/uncharacterized repeat protein (TIGR01451 family)